MSSLQKYDRLSWLAGLLLLSSALGCGARTEYRASHLEMQRPSWDSLHVDVTFAKRTAIGGGSEVDADSVVVTVFDSGYDTLYSGVSGFIPIPDARLGDRERLMVEVCGLVRQRQICVQESLQSSPKRLHVAEQITYPRSGDLEQGSYELKFRVERRAFDGDGWEEIEPVGVKGHLVASVADPEAKEKGAVRIPFDRSQGQFNLSRYENYKNFKYYLDSQLLDHQTAEVLFDVYAGMGENAVHLASTTKEVHRKTENEREREVRFFAEQAAEMIIDELGSFLGARSAYAYVEGWNFNSIARTYEIELEIEWEGPVFDRGDYEIEGILDVEEDGLSARFTIRGGNRRAVRRWRTRTDRETLPLGRLDVYREDDTAAFQDASGRHGVLGRG